MRLRSAQLGGCAPCSASRKDESITEDEVACLIDPERAGSDARERPAIRLVDLMATDHHAVDDHAVDDGFLRRLAEVFTVEEIVELS